MGSVSATVIVRASASNTYSYLRGRYESEAHRSASLATKGYVPAVTRTADEAPRFLAFRVPGRDPLLRVFVSGWRWSYLVEPDGESASRVTIRYEWGWLMWGLSGGLVRHQAANEIAETALALDALGARLAEASGEAEPPKEQVSES